MAEPDLGLLLYWIEEREQIRERKERGVLPPWTTDPILREYRFCNVRRSHDRVSRWLLQNVLTAERFQEAGFDSFVMFTALCRWINWPPTIKFFMDCQLWPARRPNWKSIIKALECLKANEPPPIWSSSSNGNTKRKVWTGAYMITARGAQPGQSKAEFIVNDVLRAGLDAKVRKRLKEAFQSGSKQAAWEILTERNNWGAFMAGQVVDDWSWTPLLWKAKDQYSWAPQGPGSVRGLNRLLGLPLRTRHSQDAWLMQLRGLRMAVINELGKQFRCMTLHDVQNCLCEYFKFSQVKLGLGKPRSIYRPEAAYEVVA